MAQTANDSKLLPPGYRSNIAYALHDDDSQAMSIQLEECRKIKHILFLTEQGKKCQVWDPNNYLPWSSDEAEESPVRKIDNELANHLYSHCWNELTIHTIVLYIAIQLGSLRVAELLLSHKYRCDVNPLYKSNYFIRVASRDGHIEVVKLLMNEHWVVPSANANEAIRWASEKGHVEIVKQLMEDPRVDPSDCKNEAIVWAFMNGDIEIVKLFLEDKQKRVDPSAGNDVIKHALAMTNSSMLRLLLADSRVVITNKLLNLVDIDSFNRVQILFTAARPRFWPSVIGNDITCVSRVNGHLRNELDYLEKESSRVLLLCVKRRFSERVAARVGDVLREVCSEWTCFRSQEVEPLDEDDEIDGDSD